MYTGEERDVPSERVQSELLFPEDPGDGFDHPVEPRKRTSGYKDEADSPDEQIYEEVDQNYFGVTDPMSIVEELESSDSFDRIGESDYGQRSYRADGIVVDVMPEGVPSAAKAETVRGIDIPQECVELLEEPDNYFAAGGRVRATVVDRSTGGFSEVVDEFMDAIEASKDVSGYEEFQREVRDSIERGYTPGQIAADGGEVEEVTEVAEALVDLDHSGNKYVQRWMEKPR